MRLKDSIELAKNPDFVSSIYNYCDRWCERCLFTSRCLLYATEQADTNSDPGTRDLNNEAFWNQLAKILQDTTKMISEWAKEQGIDLSPEALAIVGDEYDQQGEMAEAHPIVCAAEHYAFAVNEWFSRNSSEPPAPKSDPREADSLIDRVDEANDFLEAIRWYQFFIAVKLTRGFLSRVDESNYEVEAQQLDSDGSVKAALIGIDRSLASWKVIYEIVERKDNAIEKFLFDLEKLRLSVEKEFPAARDFIRPGLDENLDTLH
jgi:hypothetical protein